MGFFSHDSEEAYAHQQVTSGHHKASWTHELIAGAASYEAAKAYEDYQRRNGKVVNHAQAKELLAGFVGAFVDREIETKGLDYIDSHRAKEARANAERALEQHEFSGGEYRGGYEGGGYSGGGYGGGEYGRGEYREEGYGREREYGREEYEEPRHHGHEHEHGHGHGHGHGHRHEERRDSREWD